MNKGRQFAVAAVGGMLLAPFAALAEVPTVPETCNVRFSESVLRSESLTTLCGCSRVTRGFVSSLQRSDVFADVLNATGQNCPALATILTETVTATVAAPPQDEEPDDDDRRRVNLGPPPGQPETPPEDEPPVDEPDDPPLEDDDVDNGW